MNVLSSLGKSRKKEIGSDATSSRSLAVREDAAAALGSAVDESVQKVEQQIEAVTVEIKTVESSIDKVLLEIDERKNEANTYAEILSNEEQFMTAWANLSGFLKRRHESEDGYYNFLKEKLAHLEKTTLPNLEKEEEQLRKEEEQLRKKKEQLREEKKRLQIGQQGVKLLDLSQLQANFDPKKSTLNGVNFGFDFVRVPEFDKVLKVMKDTADLFWGRIGRQKVIHFKFPVVDGASGAGKTRLCWEISKHMADESGGIHLFFDCRGEGSNYLGGDEKNKMNCDEKLAQILFDHLVNVSPTFSSKNFSLPLDGVLERIKQNTGSTVVVLQVDEYSTYPEVTRMILRACRGIVLRGLTFGPGVLVLPVLSGIAYLNVRAEFSTILGDKLQPDYTSLCGISSERINDLWAAFDKEVNLGRTISEIRNLALIMSTFGGYPRLFEWLLDMLVVEFRNSPIVDGLKKGNLSSDDAKILYNGIRDHYISLFGVTKMLESLRTNPATGTKDEVVSERTFKRAVEYMKRIHTLAITGQKVNVDKVFWRDPTVADNTSRSLMNLSTTGLFTLTLVEKNLGTVHVPLIAIDSCCTFTGIGPDGILSPFSYSWSWMEVVAMISLRCRWNSLWYSRDLDENSSCMVKVNELRPGALFNDRWLKQTPHIKIDKELSPLTILAEPFRGDTSTSFHTGSDGNGSLFSVQDRTIFLMAANEAGNDGGAFLKPFAWLTQCKSLELGGKMGTGLTKGGVSDIQAAQEKAAKEFDFGQDAELTIYDIFTNRREGPRFQTNLIPDYTFVTSMDNIETVAGPLFGMSKKLFEITAMSDESASSDET